MKNKPITPAVLTALRRWYVEETLSQEQIAQIAGVNRSSVNAWLAGEAKAIRAVNWVRLLPYLRQYLFPEESDAFPVFSQTEALITDTLTRSFWYFHRFYLSASSMIARNFPISSCVMPQSNR
ncbi:MAG: helix-turn-helix transcriptional regulator [Lentisphaeria bacterium]|nr:helix-turn-helix transcriptional regulator [Lentisphaeria bacterium]